MTPSWALSLRTIFIVLVAGSICSARAAGPVSRAGIFMFLQGASGFSTTPASPIDLGPLAVGVSTPHGFPTQLQINNPGTAPLVISNVEFPLGAAFTSETQIGFPATVPPGSTVTAGALFTPQAAGKQTIQASALDNAAGNPHIIVFTGTGVAVPANDYAIILDPGAVSPLSVTAGSTTSFPVWLLGGPGGVTTIKSHQCSGGPVGTLCNLDIDGTFVDGGFSFGRQQVMVSVTVPSKSASLDHTFALWGIAGSATFLLLCWTRRNPAPFIAILLMGAFIASCGGGSKNNTPAPPTGTDSLVITVTPNVGTAHTLAVPLAVQ